MKASDLNPQFSDPSQDLIQQRQIHNSRKPTITLKALNKLKKMRAAKDLENLMRNDFMQIIYGMPAEEEGGDLGI